MLSMTSPVVLVLDDVHVLRNSECRAALSVLADHVPRGSRLVLSGRDEPPLRIARLRAEGRVLEIGPGDLSLTRDEASSLLRDAGIALGEEEVAELHRRTEGWPAGLYLAALYIREGGSLRARGGLLRRRRPVRQRVRGVGVPGADLPAAPGVPDPDRGAGADVRAAVRSGARTVPGSAATLADLARSNLLLVPLDRRGEWYRYHHLFRDMLLAELDRMEPGLIPVLRRRAAGWCVRNDLPEEALEYSMAAGDVDAVARLVGRTRRCRPTGRAGSPPSSGGSRWLEDRGGIEGHPMAAVLASFVVRADGPAGRGRAVGRCGRSLAIRGRGAAR